MPRGEFLNSTSLQHPHLAFLGDNFSVPRTWPLANVFSAGDIVLAVGALLLLHSVCGSRPVLRAPPPPRPGGAPTAGGGHLAGGVVLR